MQERFGVDERVHGTMIEVAGDELHMTKGVEVAGSKQRAKFGVVEARAPQARAERELWCGLDAA